MNGNLIVFKIQQQKIAKYKHIKDYGKFVALLLLWLRHKIIKYLIFVYNEKKCILIYLLLIYIIIMTFSINVTTVLYIIYYILLLLYYILLEI